jgi:hypothetical protein
LHQQGSLADHRYWSHKKYRVSYHSHFRKSHDAMLAGKGLALKPKKMSQAGLQ